MSMPARPLLEPAGGEAAARSRLGAATTPAPRWRGLLAGPPVAALTVLVALGATHRPGVPLRDPDHVAALYLALGGCGGAPLVGPDTAIPAGPAARAARPPAAPRR